MTSEERDLKDPVIDEVRARRQKLMGEHGNDLESLYETLQRLQEEHPEKIKDRRRRAPSRG